MGLFDSTNTTSTQNPLWDLQAQHLPGIYDTARDIYNQGDQGPYAGSTVAGLDPVRAQGLNLGVDAALGAQTDLAKGQTDLLSGILSGTDAGTQTLANQAAQASQGIYGTGGTLGSARGQQAAANAASQAILGRQLQASGQVAQAQNNATRPGATLAGIGTTTQGQTQAEIDADVTRHQDLRNQPFNWLNQYRNVIGSPQAPTETTNTTSPSFVDQFTEGLSLFGFAEGGEVPRTPSFSWETVDGRPQIQINPEGPKPSNPSATSGRYIPPVIDYNPETQATQAGSYSPSPIVATAPNYDSVLPSDYTTYGGSRDNAHQMIDEAFTEYGKAITAGTARPEDNPAYNAESAAVNSERPVTYTTNDGESVTKKAGELTSADFENASAEDQYALSYASMAAAGIKNLGGGYNQNDPTTGVSGAINDGLNYAIDWAADTLPEWSPTGFIANQFDSPNSTYDPVGVNTPVVSNRDDGPSAAQIAADNARNTASNVTGSDRAGGAALDSAFGISGLAEGGEVGSKPIFNSIMQKMQRGM